MATLTFNSPSQMTAILGRPHGIVMAAVRKLGITPVARIDSCDYYSDAQVERLREHFEKNSKGMEPNAR